MPNVEQHEVHIQTLYSKIDELSKDCENQHKAALEATLRIHQRIDEFTRIMVQLSELVKDVQSTMAHQKALESKIDSISSKIVTIEKDTLANTEVSGWVKKGLGLIVGAVIVGLLALLGLKG